MSLDIGFLVYPQFQLLDLSGPLAAFQVAGRISGTHPYRLRVVSPTGGLVASSSGIEIFTNAIDECFFDTFIVVGGGETPTCPVKAAELASIAQFCAPRARRVGSVCTGAFILAAAGILDGKRATTHWRYSAALQRLFPRVKIDRDRIFCKDGLVWTSAGISAGIDVALAMIEEDLGTDLSRAVAQDLVVYHRRPGGQSQFSTLLELEPESDRIREALSFARQNLHQKLTVDRLAEIAFLSPRQFSRAFMTETGETPAKAVERLRAEAARVLIETSSEPIETIARQVGFADPERMRRAFLRLFGQPPQGVRRAARATNTT
ncbi:MAG: GlxA family transcriptional regulator [Gammaproteobacteria bacterium]|nr:MAG: GlxA family transcriptional regulator [Gammaproteobacteria bacterium]